MTMTDVRFPYPNVPTSWPSAGIVDARAFYIADDGPEHLISHAGPTKVRGLCGVVVSTDLAAWSSGYEGRPICPTCAAK